MNLTHEEVLDLLPAYVVDALEEPEQLAVDQYIAAQYDLLQSLKRTESAATLIAHAAGNESLPQDAKSRMMMGIRSDLGVDPEADTVGKPLPETDAAPHQVGLSGVAQTETEVRPQSTSLPREHHTQHEYARPAADNRGHRNEPSSTQPNFWNRIFSPRPMVNALAATALVALVFLAYFEARHLNELNSLRGEATVVEEQLAITQDRASVFESTIGTLQERINILETANNDFAQANAELAVEQQKLTEDLKQDQERITLVGAANRAEIMFGTDEAPGLQGAFYLSGTDGAIVVHGLKPLPSEQTYQFWLVLPDGRQIPATLVPVHGDQEPTWARFALPQEVPGFTAVGISIEPAGGSPAPTGPMLLASEIG